MEAEHILGICFLAGIILTVAWIVALIIGTIFQVVWGWLDDNENPITHNPLISKVMRMRGYSPENGLFAYRKRGKSSLDGDWAIFIPAMILFCFPIMAALSFLFYPFALTGLTLLIVAHIARFVRRHKKLFDKHVKEPGAHG